MHNNSTFAGLGISPITLLALEQKGFTEPTPIQAEVIPKVLTSDVDIIAKARTGTGKTAAFGIPLLELCEESAGFVQSLILTPTRELALQVCNEIESFRGKRRHQLAPVYGGQAIRPQIMALKKNPAIVVGTPGRVLDHVRGKRLNLSQLKFLVLDEADEMLDMGFQEDLEAILSSANEERRTLLFSATMPDRLRKIAQGYMKNTVTIQVKAETKEENRTERIAYEVHASDKPDALARILEFNPDFFGIIFCRTKMDTDELARNLQQRGFVSEALHGDLSQAQREKILRWFKNSQRGALVATDVAARGIDISNLTHVVNYAVPDTAEALTHRIGRTARAGKTGIAITLVSPSDFSRFRRMERETGFTFSRKALPTFKEVIAARRSSLKERVSALLGKTVPDDYIKLAEELTQLSTPEYVIGALLQDFYRDTLSGTSGRDIEPLAAKGGQDEKRGGRGGSRDRKRGFSPRGKSFGNRAKSGGKSTPGKSSNKSSKKK